MSDRLTDEELRELLERANKGGDAGAHQHLAANVRSFAAEVLELRAENTRLRERVGILEPLRSGVHVVEP